MLLYQRHEPVEEDAYDRVRFREERIEIECSAGMSLIACGEALAACRTAPQGSGRIAIRGIDQRSRCAAGEPNTTAAKPTANAA